MNDEVKNALNELLAKFIDGVEKAGEFAIEQVPEVIQQAMTWFIVKSGITFTIGLLILIVSLLGAYYGFKNRYEKDADGKIRRWSFDNSRCLNQDSIIAIVICLTSTIVGTIVIAESLAWLQILIAPKWFIVSEMSKLL